MVCPRMTKIGVVRQVTEWHVYYESSRPHPKEAELQRRQSFWDPLSTPKRFDLYITLH